MKATPHDGPSDLPAEPAAPSRKRPRGRRQIISKVATEMFAERGFDGTSVGDIAERVGISGGAIYRHFSNKEHILQEILADSFVPFVGLLGEVDAPVTPADRVVHILRRTVEETLADAQVVTVYLRERHRLSGEVRTKLRADGREALRNWHQALHAVLPDLTTDEANLRQRVLNGVQVSLATDSHALPAPQLTDLAVGILTAITLAAPQPRAEEPAANAWVIPRTRRQEILDAAASLFQSRGFHGVGVDDIGTAAGITGPTIYGTYTSKLEILIDACDRSLGRIDTFLRPRLVSAGSAEEAVHAVASGLAHAHLDKPAVFALTSREYEALPPDDRARIMRAADDQVQTCANVVAEASGLGENEARSRVLLATSIVHELARFDDRLVPGATALADLLLIALTAAPGTGPA
ncbi:TetR/AcrR family transcriptional regulator [Amycolatopsis jejuensis]|uniref:TetR/AcrR family transcriptional regulator n=1 Tax=Amycolatopsis jejuensis TaxID=330084 RepID=UPI000527DBC4|nr:TetR/AcrR family transcriptional regulator [Amycolatopsis jejuensis]